MHRTFQGCCPFQLLGWIHTFMYCSIHHEFKMQAIDIPMNHLCAPPFTIMSSVSADSSFMNSENWHSCHFNEQVYNITWEHNYTYNLRDLGIVSKLLWWNLGQVLRWKSILECFKWKNSLQIKNPRNYKWIILSSSIIHPFIPFSFSNFKPAYSASTERSGTGSRQHFGALWVCFADTQNRY